MEWYVKDVTEFIPPHKYACWHDRAVFHFLNEAEDREEYKDSLNQALKVNGHLIISTFSPDAPPECSGLPVVRYSPEALQNVLGDNFILIESLHEEHLTPSGVKQNFIFCRFTKRF